MCANDQIKRRNAEYVRKSRRKLSDVKKKHINQYYCRSWKAWVGRKTHSSIAEDKLKSRAYNITPSYIMELLELNNYKCAISGVDMTHDKTLLSMSIDRIDNNIGHIEDNIQLINLGFNLAKNRHTDDDLGFFFRCICSGYNHNYKTFRTYISECIRNAVRRDKIKGFNTDLQTDHVIDLYNKNNRCYFSNIEMVSFRHPTISVSIDRIDNSKPHDLDNIRLVCKAINRVKGSRSDSEVFNWIEAIRNGY